MAEPVVQRYADNVKQMWAKLFEPAPEWSVWRELGALSRSASAIVALNSTGRINKKPDGYAVLDVETADGKMERRRVPIEFDRTTQGDADWMKQGVTKFRFVKFESA